MHLSLENLHQQFTTALHTHVYLGLSSDNKSLKSSLTKEIRLQQVFTMACNQITDDLNQRQGKEIEKQISLLQCLEKDGELYYQRYVQATNSWTRVFLKGLARYTPDYLKRFLPACFSNRMEEAENQTKKEYENYKKFLKEKIDNLSKIKKVDAKDDQDFQKPEVNDLDQEVIDPEDDLDDKAKIAANKDKDPKEQFFDEEDPELQKLLMKQFQAQQKNLSPKAEKQKLDEALDENIEEDILKDEIEAILVPSTEEIEKQEQERILSFCKNISDKLQILNQFQQKPISLNTYKRILGDLRYNLQIFKDKYPNNPQKFLEEKVGLNQTAFEFFTDPKLIKALSLEDNQTILDMLQPTGWQASFQEALDQKSHVRFGVRRMGNSTFLQLLLITNGTESRINDSTFANYRGKIVLTFKDSTQTQNELNELLTFMKTHANCRPHKIDIDVKDDYSLNIETFRHLLTLSDNVAEIEIKGLKSIDFKALAVSAQEEHQFIQRLGHIHLPDLITMTLTDDPKKDWTALDFCYFLYACPSLENLKESYRLCPTPQNIIIPYKLSGSITEMDLSDYALEHIAHLLSQFPLLKTINLSGLQITDVQLIRWINAGLLINVESLNLDKCPSFTTDILYELTTLSYLTKVSLPDLPQGKRNLKNLPTFDNPFKIKLFYCASKITQKLVSSLYTGPMAWAAVFQIPLARQGVTDIFSPRQTILDPKSVGYWLHEEDFKKLVPQPGIKTILADSNAGINDDNLTEFVQKFPNANLLSLYNCPNVTHKGIIRLLKACPKIKSLDLMGCSNITEQLFYDNKENIAILKNLTKLNLTNTRVVGDIVDVLKAQEQMKNIMFEETVLTITDDQLTDETALEKILEAKNLNKLKCIDLTGCTKLTDTMLGQLLDHLNAPMWKETAIKDGLMEDNLQRLNLAVLNLTGCTNISDKAFQSQQQDQALEFKLLEVLDRIIIDGTQISPALGKVYPSVTFQQFDEPATIQINPDVQLKECQEYLDQKKLMAFDPNAKKNLKKLGEKFIHNRVVVELFSKDPKAADVLNQAVDPNAEEFSNFTVSFKADDQEDSIVFQTHRDALFSQSLFFVHGFRPGGTISKISGLDFSFPNSNIVQLVMDTLLGKTRIDDLDWKTAGKMAEPVGTSNYNLLKGYYNALLQRIRTQFDLSRAKEMFDLAIDLRDHDGIKQYENTLLFLLETYSSDLSKYRAEYNAIAGLAASYELSRLKKKIEQIQKVENDKITKNLLAEQEAENLQLVKQMQQSGLLGNFV